MAIQNPRKFLPYPPPAAEDIKDFCNASRYGDMDLLVSLLDTYGAAIIDQKDDIGDTALTWASWSGQEKAVALLVERGAAIDLQALDGNTALMWAVIKDQKEIVTLLLEKGAATDKVNNRGDTAVTLAESKSSSEIMAMIQHHTKLRDKQHNELLAEQRRQEEDSRAQSQIDKLKTRRPPKPILKKVPPPKP